MNKILILVDCQNDFLSGSLAISDTAVAASAVSAICNKIINWTGDILVTQDTHEEDTYKYTREGQHIPIHCIKYSWGWDINPYIQSALNERRNYKKVLKHSFGKFSLPSFVLDNLYEGIEICGFCTDICVISNALILRAAYPNVPISVISSCCAGTSLENHQKALDIMKMNCIDII